MADPELPSPSSENLLAGEWLFKSGELVFGPIPGSVLMAKLESGELPPDTPVAREGGPFTPIGEVTVFVTVAAKASARQRVEAQLREDLRRLRRRRALKLGALVAATTLGVGVAVGGVLWAVRAGLFDRSFDELAAIEILASPPLVAVKADGQGPVDELEYIDDAPAAAAASPRRAQGSAAAAPRREPGRQTSPAAGGAFDQGAIQAVVQANQNSLHRCLREQVAREPAFRGEVPLSFTVGNRGRVVRVWVDRPGHGSGPLFDCIEAELGKWRFPIFDGERPSVSLSFRVGG